MSTIICIGLVLSLIIYLYDYYEPSFDTGIFNGKEYIIMWYNTYINTQEEPKRDYIKLFKK